MKNKEVEIFFLQNDWEFPPIIINKNTLLEIIFGGMDSSNAIVSGNSPLKTKITIQKNQIRKVYFLQYDYICYPIKCKMPQ